MMLSYCLLLIICFVLLNHHTTSSACALSSWQMCNFAFPDRLLDVTWLRRGSFPFLVDLEPVQRGHDCLVDQLVVIFPPPLNT